MTKATSELIERIVNQGIRPHAPELAVIGFSGDVAVVVFEPGEDAKETARDIGWDGESAVFRLSEQGTRALAGSGKTAMAKWLRKKFDPAAPVARVYVLTGDEPLLLNYSSNEGWYPEPSASDRQGLS